MQAYQPTGNAMNTAYGVADNSLAEAFEAYN
jgi:hypothetical protein